MSFDLYAKGGDFNMVLNCRPWRIVEYSEVRGCVPHIIHGSEIHQIVIHHPGKRLRIILNNCLVWTKDRFWIYSTFFSQSSISPNLWSSTILLVPRCM